MSLKEAGEIIKYLFLSLRAWEHEFKRSDAISLIVPLDEQPEGLTSHSMARKQKRQAFVRAKQCNLVAVS